MSHMPLELVSLFVTMRCNLACPFCASSSHRERHEVMSLETLERIAQDIHEYRLRGEAPISEIRLTGGEPFMYPNLLQAVDAFAFVQHRTIVTNATLIDDKMLTALKERDVQLLTSIYPDATGTTLTNWDGLRRIYSSGINAIATLVVTKRLVPTLSEILDRIEQLHPPLVVITAVNAAGRSAASFLRESLNDHDVVRVRKILQGRSNHGHQFRPPHTIGQGCEDPSAGRFVPACQCANGHLSIGVDGAVLPCNSMLSFVVGYWEPAHLIELYEHPKMRFLRRLRTLRQQDIRECCDCSFADACNGGSRIQAYLRSGDWLAVDPRSPCSINRDRLHLADEVLARDIEELIGDSNGESARHTGAEQSG